MNRALGLVVFAASFLFSSASFAQNAANPPQAADSLDVADARTALKTRISAVDFQGTSLVDVLDYLRDVGRMNLFVNWPALEAAGVSRDTQISLKLRQLPMRKVLDLTLQQAGPGLLSWYVSENVVHVTTADLASRRLITRVYPVLDLLVEVPNFEAPSFNLEMNNTGGGGRSGGTGGSRGGGGGSSQGLFGGGGSGGRGSGSGRDADESTSINERAQDLIDLIMLVIDPDNWDSNGGPGRIRFFYGSLIVTAPQSTHEKLARQ